MYKIYINKITVLLVDNPQVIDIEALFSSTVLIVKYINPSQIEDLADTIEKQNVNYIYIWSKDLKKLKKNFFKSFSLIRASGGVVVNEKQQILLIYRNDKWDFPKGKIEKNEKKKAAAVREVEEESGVDIHKINQKICITYHTYRFGRKKVLKKTYWYIMESIGESTLIPQIEEGIEKAVWVDRDKVGALLRKNSYPSILDVWQSFLNKQEE